ncbi:MAG: sensor histidine kinase, partial [Lachnospiraceae bacterium]|nr:sensor histidine kinase [Lachnospiraceae bacterium]
TPERLAEVSAVLMSDAPADNTIYGLYNVNERIKLKFGSKYGISLDSVYGEGSTCNILLPAQT